MSVKVQLVEYGAEKTVIGFLELGVCPDVGEWVTRVRDNVASWNDCFAGIRCYRVVERRFFSNGVVRLVVDRGEQYENMMVEELGAGGYV